MIKHISHQNIITTPFIAFKAWELYNNFNNDLVLLEPYSSSVLIPNTYVALEYTDFSVNPPTVNSSFDIALEQQEDDLAIFEEGISGSGFFNPYTDETNRNGSFKRLVYNQTAKAFYNKYRNPLQIFGMENIDFPLSKTNKYLGNEFLLFTIPKDILGDGLVEGTIQMYDTSLDDNVVITDDSYGNLVAKENLFSKIQEVRVFGNDIQPGSVLNFCFSTTTTTTTSTTSTTTTTTTPTTTTTTTTTPTTTTTTTTPTTTTTTTTSTTTTPTTTTTSTTTSTTTTPTTTTTTTTSTTTPTTTTTTTTSTTTPTTTTTTSTTSTTTTTIDCGILIDCSYFPDTLIPMVHWSGAPGSGCGCTCMDRTCDLNTACNALVMGGIINVPNTEGTSDCVENDGFGGCTAGSGQNLPSEFTACYEPVIQALIASQCGYSFTYETITGACQTLLQITVDIA